MIILNDPEEGSSGKFIPSQSGILISRPPRAASVSSTAGSPPLYSETETSRNTQHTSTTSSGSQLNHDVEANPTEAAGSETQARSSTKYRSGCMKLKRHLSIAMFASFILVMAWRFIKVKKWEHHLVKPIDQWSFSHPPPPPHHHRNPSKIPLHEASEIAKDLATLRSFCISNGTWFPTVRHPSTPYTPYHFSSSSLYLPLHTSTLFLISRIPGASGKLQVLSSTIPEHGPQIFVTARHVGEHALDNVSICLMEKLPGVLGAALFRDENGHFEPVDFTITLLLPASSSIYDLETDLPKYSHNLNLQTPLGSVSLTSKGMPIVANIEARDIEITTSHAPIEGNFKASELLSLATTHSPISVNVTLENDSSSFTSVEFENTHSSITANLDLVSSASEGGKYEIEVSAPNTELNLVFPSSPLNSVLRLESITSELPCHITLPPQYGGTFELVSRGGVDPTIVAQSGDDPVIVRSKEDDGSVTSGVVRAIRVEGTSVIPAAGSVNVTTSKASSTLVFQ